MPTLNNDTVAKLPLAAAGRFMVRDDKLPGFFVVVGKRAKTVTVQVDGRKPDGPGPRAARKSAPSPR